MTIYILQKFRDNYPGETCLTLGCETDEQKANDEIDRLKEIHRTLSGAYHSIGAEPTDPKILAIYKKAVDVNRELTAEEEQTLQAFFDKQRLTAKIVFKKYGADLNNYSPDYEFRVVPVETYQFKPLFLEQI